ncbi:HAMP domain-containing sensor histidine kinase [Bacillus piscicola]|uniref:HAMP domain-containing sensor histidine kinase n=1 Tax=Bacillus piscicola TaxID=1632684 RepID=UPI001F09BFB0|nr:HAMP domain-containing sensor histidine kinase [Bacillus piscicola]
MKLKYWLSLTHLIVMLLPVIGVILLIWIMEQAEQNRMLEEHLSVIEDMHEVEGSLQHPALYEEADREYEELEQILPNDVDVTLYSPTGYVLFSTFHLPSSSYFYSRENLYQNLYELDRRYSSYALKNPVFSAGQIAGVYEIVIPRTAWVAEARSYRGLIIGGFVIGVGLFYVLIMYWLSRKVTNPLFQLMEQIKRVPEGRALKDTNIPKQNDEVGHLIQSFEQMENRLQSAQKERDKMQEEKKQIMASMSHDLKTPLTTIRTYAETLQKRQGKNDDLFFTSTIIQKAEQMKRLIEDLHTFVHLQRKEHVNKKVEVDVEELCDMLFSGYEEWCLSEGIHYHSVNRAKGRLMADVSHLTRVIDNLVHNAMTYTSKTGTILTTAFQTIDDAPDDLFREALERLNKKGHGFWIVVQNDGPTMSEEDSILAFEPFVHLPQKGKKDSIHHSGLGLSIVKQIIEEHGGTVQMIPCHQKGTVIAVWLPKK